VALCSVIKVGRRAVLALPRREVQRWRVLAKRRREWFCCSPGA
jgi:hypothetical protein